ncbi:MAG TPA: FG-GAP repeat protein [Methylomirabilota bacterium]|nr:FG-GAP repeat protein [Methylomirabilota bacterium]
MYDYEDGEPYIPPVPKRRATAGQDYTFSERRTEQYPRQQAPPKKRHHYLFWIGLGMCFFLGIWTLWSMVVSPWIHGIELQWHYGDNRISVFGADVSHGGVSRFVVFEDGQEIVIVEVVAKKYTVYTIPFTGIPGKLVTLSVADVNGDGKLDLIVHVDGEEGSFALINTGSGFSWSR